METFKCLFIIATEGYGHREVTSGKDQYKYANKDASSAVLRLPFIRPLQLNRRNWEAGTALTGSRTT